MITYTHHVFITGDYICIVMCTEHEGQWDSKWKLHFPATNSRHLLLINWFHIWLLQTSWGGKSVVISNSLYQQTVLQELKPFCYLMSFQHPSTHIQMLKWETIHYKWNIVVLGRESMSRSWIFNAMLLHSMHIHVLAIASTERTAISMIGSTHFCVWMEVAFHMHKGLMHAFSVIEVYIQAVS